MDFNVEMKFYKYATYIYWIREQIYELSYFVLYEK